MTRPWPPITCAACGWILEGVIWRSVYFDRPLCGDCFKEEPGKSKAEAEIWWLEKLYRQPAS